MTGPPGYVSDLVNHVEHFQRRVVQDALVEATAAYWQGRADQFDLAAPRPGDYVGRATTAEVEARWNRMTSTGQACRHRAALSLIGGQA